MSTKSEKEVDSLKGPVAWMAKNSVASNLFMFILLFVGAVSLIRTKQEVLPEFNIDMIVVSVAYPGAAPEEVEQGIVLALEEAVRGVDDVKRIQSTAAENVGSMVIVLNNGVDSSAVLNDVKSAVDRVTTFPEDAEEPQVRELTLRREVITLILSGDQELSSLQELAEVARSELREDPEVSQVEVEGIPPLEMSIEVPQMILESHGLTLNDVAMQVKLSSLELPAGGVKTEGGEILVRVADRKKTRDEFSNIIIRSSFQGAELRLGDIATITDGYADSDEAAFYNGKPAVRLVIYRIGDQTPIAVAAAVKSYQERIETVLPDTVDVAVWKDSSEMLKGRIELLMDNAKIGLILVFIILALFLDFRLAFWVGLGIPISFLGSFIILGETGATINMISLFAYIITLGMVVDDAIIVGENIYDKHESGMPWLEAAIKGAQEMIVPVSFAILTTIAAFSPLLLVPGVMGKFFRLIPLVVIAVLILSLLESFFVLPAHLAHMKEKRKTSELARIMSIPRHWVATKLKTFINGPFDRILRRTIDSRYITLSIAISIFMITIGSVIGGLVPFTFFPAIEGDVITISARLPYGVALEQTANVQETIEQTIEDTIEQVGGREGLVRGTYSTVGAGLASREGVPKGSHLTAVSISLVPLDQRTIGTGELADLIKANMPALPGVENLKYASSLEGPGAGADIDLQLVSSDFEQLAVASGELTDILHSYSSLISIENSYSGGKPQLDFQIRPEARSLGITSSEVGRQVRASFFGAEALREQKGRFERRTMVRLPEAERQAEGDISSLKIRTPKGGFVPIEEVVTITRGQSPTAISREDGVRMISVKAYLAPGVKSSREVLIDLDENVFPSLEGKYPGLEISLGGEQRDQAETGASLGPNYLLALFAIFTLLAIPFKSYIQPIIVMSAIPFGFVGAVAGHVLMGYSLSMLSMFGIVALTGVVVNDSLVLIDATNKYRWSGIDAREAILMGAKRRFRPILLTSLTTFLGLAPMILETSVQARFLIPMAISLGFGVLFATFVILLLVPALYLIVEDLIALKERIFANNEWQGNVPDFEEVETQV